MFDPDFILPDEALTLSTPFDVAAFLDQLKSPLADLTVSDGDTRVLASTHIQKEAGEVGMDPRVLLVKLQVEQSLLTAEPTPGRLDWAMGYGATDSGTLDGVKGFARQVRLAAEALTGHLKEDHPFTVADAVGRPLRVSDGEVVPRTRATAALYRYTPWIGNRPVAGYQPPFGNHLFYVVWTQLFGSEPQAAAAVGEEGWRLVVPPDNWRNPLDLPAAAVAPVREAARRLRLVATVDPDRRKLYLGPPPAAPAEPAPSPPPPAKGKVQKFPLVTLSTVEDAGSEASRYRPARPDRAAPLLLADPAVQLSPHFRMGEFMPRDSSYRYVRISARLVELLERLREELGGKPLQVTSGYRPPAYNAAVGGASASVHLDGLAADVVARHVPLARLFDTADRLVGDRGGVGRYWGDGFVHVDLRGERARWP